jgi:predicted RNA-binding Zn ribbon-like protein
MTQKGVTITHKNSPTPEFLFLADHRVLDLLNTVAMVDGQRKDFLGSDEDVLRWLERAGYPRSASEDFAHGALEEAARTLREAARSLIEQRKSGVSPEPKALNRLLAHAISHPKLVATLKGGMELQREYQGEVADRLLAPLAESIAEFVATADFQLVRHCEGEGCILWFYDRTKSHRRRWCSMGVCGNRHKVSAYRARQLANLV